MSEHTPQTDPAAVMAAHQSHMWLGSEQCNKCRKPFPCEPYCLAAKIAALRGQVAAAWDEGYDAAEAWNHAWRKTNPYRTAPAEGACGG